MEQPVNIQINIELETLPECKEKLLDASNSFSEYTCRGYLLPVMDTTKEGVPYLKGWFCPECKTTYTFKAGDMIKGKLGGENR